MEKKNVFETLSKINVNDHTEKRNNLTYLSWSWAWAEVSKLYDCKYEVVKYDRKPYLYDENLGYMVFTNVTIEGDTKEMWLPVMDGANKAMKDKPYKYKTRYGEKSVEAATMFDINKTIMRCLVKNLAMFGLGLYIYSGEDLPETEPKQLGSAEQKNASVTEKFKKVNLAKVEITPEEEAAINDDLSVTIGNEDDGINREIDEALLLIAKGKKVGIDAINNTAQNSWFCRKLGINKLTEGTLADDQKLASKFNRILSAKIDAVEKRG